MHPVGKTTLDLKMNDTFSDGLDELLSPCEVCGRLHNARRLYVRKCGVCMLFSVLFSSRYEAGMPFVRGVHSSNKHCIAIYRPISTRFSAFLQNGQPFQVHQVLLIFVARNDDVV